MRVAERRSGEPPADTGAGGSDAGPSDDSRAYSVVAIVMVVMLCTIIVSGAIVRLSNSGLGCSDWPRCEPGHFTSLGTINQRIEQFNRFYSGLIIVPILVSLLLAYRTRPRTHPRHFVALSWTLVVLYLFEAVLGGIAVKVNLQWVSVMSHFLLAIILLGVALVNLERARVRRDVAPLTALARRLVIAVWLGVVIVIVFGTLVTAAGPHGGDRLHAERLAWPIEDAARTHGVMVNITLALLLVLIWRLRRERHAAGVQAAGLLLIAMFVQAGIGYVQWWEQIPPVLVGFHVAGATIVFVAATLMLLTLVGRRAHAEAAARGAPDTPDQVRAAGAEPAYLAGH